MGPVMPHPLDGCWTKIERAKEQIQYLNTETTTLLNSGAYSITGECQPECQRYAFKILGPPVPLRIAAIAGEIIHQLRSSFDHVVWALASKNGIPDTKRIAFPVCSTPEKYEKAVRNGIIKGVSASDRPPIERSQPYWTSDPANSILQIVHDLDIADKHRLLVVVTHALVMGNSITITKNNSSDPTFGIELPSTTTMRYPWSIEEGIETHWIPLRGTPGSELEMHVNSAVQIAFEQVGTHKREVLIPLLMQLYKGVKTALREFEGCF
jgi:hypothetical protein